MQSDVTRREKALLTLQKLLGPVVHRRVWRRRLKRSAKAAAAALVVAMPDDSVWQAEPLLAAWSSAALQRLREGATLMYREAGMTLALAKEPKGVSGVFWLLTGKVTQVPTKAETRECAMEMPVLKNRTGPLTGPVVFPTLFSRGTGGGGVEASSQRVALVPKVETVLDSLLTFSAGTLVDAAALVLGSQRQRALRCQAASTLLFIPSRVLEQELQILRGIPLRTTRDAAKAALQGTLARRGDKPSLHAILVHNPLLGTLETTVLRRLYAQLQPFAFGVGDVICADVFCADTVHFLRRGQVLVRSGRGAEVVRHEAGTSFGLHSFVPYEYPLYFDERRSVTARTYCEVWSLSLPVLLRICELRGRLACAAQVAKTLGIESVPVATPAALRAAPCFSVVSDETIAGVVKALRVHVGLPGDCLLSSRRPAKSGVLVLSGHCVLAEHRDDAARTSVTCGTPMYFCESFAGVKSAQSIYAESSCLVLYGSPSTILDQLDTNGCPYEETRLILESSTHYVEHVYGRQQLEMGQAQERAISRVKTYKQKQKSESAEQLATANAGAPRGRGQSGSTPDAMETRLALENQVMTSLALQLQSLHDDPLAAERFKHLHGLDTDVVWNRTSDDAVPNTEAQGKHPRGSDVPDATAAGCFTLDENGALVHASSVPREAVRRGSSSAWQPRKGGYNVRALPQDGAAPDLQEMAVPTARPTSHSPSVPPQSITGLAHQRGVLRTRDLHVPFSEPRAASYTQERRRTPPSRLQPLRKEANALIDEAYGIDPKAERSRYVPKRL